MFSWTVVLLVLQIHLLRGCSARTVIVAHEENGYNEGIPKRSDERNHPCRRPCKVDAPPMDCHYDFTVELYYTMSKACYDCPFNVTDCFRPHCISADGVRRPITVINRQLPGPSIEVCQGDRIIVDVKNAMPSESTTIHWHGQLQHLTPYMDGVPQVTQCPILPGSTFRYQFTAENAGTHFWHSHIGLQRGDGHFGQLIVRTPFEKDSNYDLYDYDDHTIMIFDWIHTSSSQMFLSHHHSNGDNKITNLLVNGLGRFQKFYTAEGIPLNMPTATFEVKQKFRYRFRIINAGFLNCPIELSFDDHVMYIVASDGHDLEPLETESLVIYAGERFDIIVEMNQDVDNYWIRFRGLMDCDERFKSAHQVAVLRYEGAPKVEPSSPVVYFHNSNKTTKQVNALNKGTESEDIISMVQLESVTPHDETLTREPDYQFYIAYDFYEANNPDFHNKHLYAFHQVKDGQQKVYTPQLNHITMRYPQFPLLSQRDFIDPSEFCNSSSVHNCSQEFCSCTHVLQVKLNSIVELILIDEGFVYDANHPFHLHGHSFRVIGMERLGRNTTLEHVKKLDQKGLLKRKLEHAPLKDTVTVPDGGYTILRFQANNPGFWIFHCHIEFHAEIGMALIFKVGEYEDFQPVPPNFPHCGNYMPSYSKNSQTKITKRRLDNVETTSMVTSTSYSRENEIGNRNKSEDDKFTSVIKWLPELFHELHLTAGSSMSAKCTYMILSINLLLTLKILIET